MSSKKELLVVGDSFCSNYVNEHNNSNDYLNKKPYQILDWKTQQYKDIYWKYIEPFSLWPDIVAKELNLKCINLSKPAASNNMIYAETLDYIIKNKKSIKKVIISWSGWIRYGFECPNGIFYDERIFQESNIDKKQKLCEDNIRIDIKSPKKYHTSAWLNLCFNNNLNFNVENLINNVHDIGGWTIEENINRFFRNIYSMQKICEALDIDLTMIQSVQLGLQTRISNKNLALLILAHPYLNEINEDKFIGYPILPEIGGFTMSTLIWTKDNKNYINERDKHPNELGHKKIAEVILEYI